MGRRSVEDNAMVACLGLVGVPGPDGVEVEIVKLPAPRLKGQLSVEEALGRRRSGRAFAPTPLGWDEVGQLLWAAQGFTHPDGLRTTPSAGAIYPLDFYVAVPTGVFQYRPRRGDLIRLSQGDARKDLREAALNQDAMDAPCVVAITAQPDRVREKYGNRWSLYVTLEVGHAAQNLLLQATALDLVGVPVGAFEDGRVKEILGLGEEEHPVYLIPIGHPVF
jgi:SagB-type dehydrogenase family enzyme